MHSADYDCEHEWPINEFDDGIDNYFPSKNWGFPGNLSMFSAFGTEGFGDFGNFGDNGFLFRLLMFALIITLVYYIINNKPF